MPAGRRFRTVALRAGVALAFVAALTPMGTSFAQSTGPASAVGSSFDAFSGASGFEMKVRNASIPLGLVVQGSGPTAQGELTSFGQSAGFASFPYPGEDVATAPGLVAAAVGVPVPEYPLIALSSAGSDPQSVEYPGVSLRAASETLRTRAEAVVGSPASGSRAQASIVHDEDLGRVVAASEATVQMLDLGGGLVISGTVSSAAATLTSGGVETDSELTVGRIRAPGLEMTVPDSAPLGGTDISDPEIGIVDGEFVLSLPVGGGSQTFALPVDVVTEAFAAAGVELVLAGAEKTDSGVVAATVTIRTTLAEPPDNTVFTGESGIEVKLGGASAFIGAAGPPPSPFQGPLDVPVASAGSDPGSLNIPGPSVAATDGPLPSPSPRTDSGSGVTSSQPSVGPIVAEPLRSAPPLDGIFDVYLLFVVSGLVGTTVSQLVRKMGVRVSWSS